ncbi:MAG: hydroxymethylbilane synthase, partial [Pseudomonadota bacterium]
ISNGLVVKLQVIKTKGDKILDAPLAKVGGKGLFVKEIEEALLRGDVDLAVHSMKDVPSEMTEGAVLSAILQRDDPRDVLVSRKGMLEKLPPQSIVGTSSLRRRCQLLRCRPDLRVQDLRGNVDTRLRKLDDGQFDAIILAAAGLTRLGHKNRVTEYLAVENWLPAAGQGAIGIQTRADDAELNKLLRNLDDSKTAICVRAERALLARLGGGCQVPIAAHAILEGEVLILRALVGHPSGEPLFETQAKGDPREPEELGIKISDQLRRSGADAVLQEVYGF